MTPEKDGERTTRTDRTAHPRHPAYDIDEAEDRRPADCPFCGHDGAFDGLGRREDEAVLRSAGVKTVCERVYYENHCPECHGVFEMLEESEQVQMGKLP